MSTTESRLDADSTGPHRVIRRRGDAYALAAGLVVTFVAAGFASGPAPRWEIEMFRSFNELSHEYELWTWPVQQLGMALAIPVGAIALGVLSRSLLRPFVLIVLSAALGWGLANIVREIVGRGRPGSFLDDVQLGYDVPTLGSAFPSGHAIVVVTLMMVLGPYLDPRVLVVAGTLALAAMLARMYVGAHMPLDLVGGAALGASVGATINLTTGIVEPRRAEMRE